MTNAGAIRILKFELYGDKESVPNISYAEYREALNMAIIALEKRIPKKPDTSYDGYADGYPVWDYYCPYCGREVDDTDHICECGQTIDWSEVEE